MSDEPKKRAAPYRARINMNEIHEVGYWLKELGVNEQTLRAAISVAGNSAEAVRKHLQRRPEIG